MVGAYYVGYKVDMKMIRDAVQNAQQLKSGFAMVLDGNNTVRLHSANVLLAEAERLFHAQPEIGNLLRKKFQTGDSKW